MIDIPLVVPVTAALEPDRNLIGGKAASLVTLLQLGAAVPPAFVITTEAYRKWAASQDNAIVEALVDEGIAALEVSTGRKLGVDLIVSVRSGAPVSMPGMMDTVLNVGIDKKSRYTEDYLCEARARFVLQYAEIVSGLPEKIANESYSDFAPFSTWEDAARFEKEIAAMVRDYGGEWPKSPRDEIVGAACAVFKSWNSARAKLYRRMRKIDEALGTSVTVQLMVFGNRDAQSGSGVAFSRNPTTGEDALEGEFLFGGQGEEIVAGKETGKSLEAWQSVQPDLCVKLSDLASRLESDTGKVYEIEFTVESGKFFVLQCRPALLTARAAACVAVEFEQNRILSQDAALEYALSQGFDPAAASEGLVVQNRAGAAASGIPVGGGVGVGRLALSRENADAMIKEKLPVVFATIETSPQLLSAMQSSAALITMRGGATSHAAVVARECGIPCVVGVGSEIAGCAIGGDDALSEGETVTVDGDSGRIYAGDVTVLSDILTEQERTLRGWACAQSSLSA